MKAASWFLPRLSIRYYNIEQIWLVLLSQWILGLQSHGNPTGLLGMLGTLPTLVAFGADTKFGLSGMFGYVSLAKLFITCCNFLLARGGNQSPSPGLSDVNDVGNSPGSVRFLGPAC